MIVSKNGRTDNIKVAIFSIILAVFSLSFGDAVIKGLSISFPLWQIYVVRSLFAVAILVVLIRWHKPWQAFIPESIRWTVTRSTLLSFMWIAYYAALPHIQLSVAAAVYYTIPLFITLFSALFTGERVGTKSWFAIVLGFAGVLIIVRPDVDGFNFYALLPLAAAILYALAMILTRTKCLKEDPKVLALALNVVFICTGTLATLIVLVWAPDDRTVASNLFLLGDWTQFNIESWLLMSGLGVIVVIGSLFSAIGYQKGPPSIVAAFDYSYLVFSAIWGLVIFNEVPDALTIFGMAMIASAGLITVRQ